MTVLESEVFAAIVSLRLARKRAEETGDTMLVLLLDAAIGAALEAKRFAADHS